MILFRDVKNKQYHYFKVQALPQDMTLTPTVAAVQPLDEDLMIIDDHQQQDDEFSAFMKQNNTMREFNAFTVFIEEEDVPEDPYEEIRADYEDEVRYDMEYLDERTKTQLPNLLLRNPTGI